MNLVPTKQRTISGDGWYTIPDYRKPDHNKIFGILDDMFLRLSKTFNIQYKIEFIDKVEDSKVYLSEYATYMNQINIHLDINGEKTVVKLKYPQLVHDNYFIMNGSLYIPLMFLERSPIDRINDVDPITGKNEGKILLNILPSFNLTFDFINSRVLYKGKKIIENDIFFSLMFNTEDDKEYIQYLIDNNIITKYVDHLDEDEFYKVIKAFDLKSLNIQKEGRDITLAEFFDDYLLLDYFKGMFKKIYNVDTIKEILKIIVKYYLDNTFIDMSDLKNRRIVINEYLINSVFEYYLRFLRNIADTKDPTKKPFNPSMNSQVLITSGFRGLMHGGSYYNISLPYVVPLLYKVSQKIYIVGEKVPRSWTANHPSAYGKICPISVSAQNMGENLIFTSDVRLDEYGLIEGVGAIYKDNIEEKD
jgi:hypothetical protein